MPVTSQLLPGVKDPTGAYSVDNSCRFDSASGSNMSRTPSSATNRRTFTISFWAKICKFDTTGYTIISAGNSSSGEGGELVLKIDNFGRDGQLILQTGPTVIFETTQSLRDPIAWYHIVVAVDTTNSTSGDRVRLYINGSEVTTFDVENQPSVNEDFAMNNNVVHEIGRFARITSQNFDGYLTEFVLIDGQQLTPTSFGEFDSDTNIWKPIDVSGLTFGTNGFYLDFEDSSSLGADVSGNGNNFSPSAIGSNDQSTDTCTNNFATFNSLIPESSSVTFSEGNLKSTGTGSDSWTTHYGVSSIAVSSGKWYIESKVTTTQTSQAILGIVDTSQAINSSLKDVGRATVEREGRITVFGSNAQTGLTAFSNGDIAAIAFDADNGTAQFYRNGSTYGSAVTSIPSAEYYFATTTYESGGVVEFNFGAPAFSISSGNSDGNGYGNFEYSVPSGYYALNTKNLAEYG